MKHFQLLLLVIASVAPCASAQNIVVNPSFETPNTEGVKLTIDYAHPILGWSMNQPFGGSGTKTYVISNVLAADGVQYLAIPSNTSISQSHLPTIKGRLYQISFSAKAGTTDYERLDVTPLPTAGYLSDSITTSPLSLGSSWLEFSFVAVGGGDDMLSLHSWSQGQPLIDNIRMELLPYPPGDVNFDGSVSLSDALDLMHAQASGSINWTKTNAYQNQADVWPWQGTNSRVHGDMLFTIQDVTEILRIAAGIEAK